MLGQDELSGLNVDDRISIEYGPSTVLPCYFKCIDDGAVWVLYEDGLRGRIEPVDLAAIRVWPLAYAPQLVVGDFVRAATGSDEPAGYVKEIRSDGVVLSTTLDYEGCDHIYHYSQGTGFALIVRTKNCTEEVL